LGGLLIAASIAIALALTKRSFRKVDEFSKHMRSIDFDTLGNRLPEENLPVELAPLARRFNEALVRLDRGAQREIRFNANVAHELRTPVAELRAIADVGLQEAREGALENPASYFEDATELAKRMARLVDTISSLNRTGLGRELIELSKTDLVELVARAWRPHEERAVSRGLSVQFDVPDTHPVETDASLVTAIITNLLVNAVSHTPKGGDLKVTLVNNRLSITNTNHDLSETDLPHLFEPFWQKDASRSDSAHFGIGMALVDAYARLLGIKVRLNLDIHERFEVALIFP
jgi:signal transduction histidine kinase